MPPLAERRRLLVQGAVQGVGFRPFIYRLATEIGIKGWVTNSAQGVVIEVEAPSAELDHFVSQIEAEKPPHSMIQRIAVETIPALGESNFEIRLSSDSGSRSTIILPDLATCPDCVRELLDPTNRRYRYPFINCTHCGPRYSIIERLPYDRPNTTMRGFIMCEECRTEYENPLDRRFHAQPIACPHCGPQLRLLDSNGATLAVKDDALLMVASVIQRGKVVALKGLGGYQLLVDARSRTAVQQLRDRKHRPEKPFAVMIPTLEQTKALCAVSELEQGLLTSSEAPIVLLRRLAAALIADNIAPGNPNLGVMLPYTPLHHLLLAELGFPIVATSGNRSGEPICIDDDEALLHLAGIADYFLVHDRPIARPVDDSVTRITIGTECVLRRARGYAPLPITLPENIPPILATGAHQKNTVAISVNQQVFLSQHIGDLDTAESVATFKQTLSDLQRLYDQAPALIACDLHPDYRSTQLAEALAQGGTLPLIRVQHHYAHVLACMAEHQLAGPVLGIAWDGTGYGTDGTIWGSEFLSITEDSFERRAYLRPFPLPGGEKAIREPRRVALGLLLALYGDDMPAVAGFTVAEVALLKTALARGINAPLTSSMGRFFDAIAALLGLRSHVSFEGQAAMDLEFASRDITTDRWYPFLMTSDTRDIGHSGGIIEYASVVRGVLADLSEGVPSGVIAAAFHNTLIKMIVAVAEQVGIEQVALTGGCFQNQRLLECSVRSLQAAEFHPYWPQKIPANDGGIALGQVMAAYRTYPQKRDVCV